MREDRYTNTLQPLMVTIHHPGKVALEIALRKFNQKVKDSRILQEVKERMEFKRPGQQRREQHMRSIIRHKNEARKCTTLTTTN